MAAELQGKLQTNCSGNAGEFAEEIRAPSNHERKSHVGDLNRGAPFMTSPYQGRILRACGGVDHSASPAAKRRPDSKNSLIIGVAVGGGAPDYNRGHGTQPCGHLSRFVEPTHMGVAGGEIAMCLGEARIVPRRYEQHRQRFVKPDPVGRQRSAGPDWCCLGRRFRVRTRHSVANTRSAVLPIRLRLP